MIEVGRVAQVGRQDHRRRRITEIDRDAAGERAGVAADEDLAVDVARHRCQLDAAEVRRGGEVGDEGVVFELLGQQQILLALGKDDFRARRREGIAVEIVDFLAVEAVGADLLIDDARRDLDARRRLEQDREAAAGTAAAVDVVADAGRRDRIDEAAIARVIADRADGRGGAERRVDRALQGPAEIVARDEVGIGLDHPLGAAERGLVGDVADGAADRPRTEQRALRAAQRLDAVQVEKIEVGGEQRQRDDRLVEVDADLLLHAGLVADDLASRDPADRDLALARTEILHGEARDVARQILDPGRAGALDVGLRLRVDRKGHVDQALLALLRGDDDRVLVRRRARRRLALGGGLVLGPGGSPGGAAGLALPALRECRSPGERGGDGSGGKGDARRTGRQEETAHFGLLRCETETMALPPPPGKARRRIVCHCHGTVAHA